MNQRKRGLAIGAALFASLSIYGFVRNYTDARSVVASLIFSSLAAAALVRLRRAPALQAGVLDSVLAHQLRAIGVGLLGMALVAVTTRKPNLEDALLWSVMGLAMILCSLLVTWRLKRLQETDEVPGPSN